MSFSPVIQARRQRTKSFCLITAAHARQARTDRPHQWWAVSTPSSSNFPKTPDSGSLELRHRLGCYLTKRSLNAMTMFSETPKASATPAAFPWGPMLVLGFAWFLGVAIELSPSGLLTAIAGDFRVSIATAGTLTTFYALGNALLVLPLTAFALRFSRRSTLMTVMAALVVSTLVVALAPTLPVADAGRFLGGASYALICTLFPAVVVRIAGPGNGVKAITVVFTATSLGTALGAPLAALTGGAFGWRVAFLGAAVLVFIAGVLMSFVIPHIRDSKHESLTLLQTARLPGVLRIAIGWALIMLAHFVVLTYIDAYLRQLGAPRYITSLALFIIGAGSILGTVLVGRVSSRSVFTALLAAPVTVAAGFVVLFLGGANLIIALTAVALWGTGLAATIVVYQQAILLTGSRAPETATSIGVLLAQTGFAAGATIGGLSINAFGIAAIPLVALVFVIGSIIIATTLRPVLRRVQTRAPDQSQAATASGRTAPVLTARQAPARPAAGMVRTTRTRRASVTRPRHPDRASNPMPASVIVRESHGDFGSGPGRGRTNYCRRTV